MLLTDAINGGKQLSAVDSFVLPSIGSNPLLASTADRMAGYTVGGTADSFGGSSDGSGRQEEGARGEQGAGAKPAAKSLPVCN